MTKVKQVYKCNVCGNIIEVLHEGAGELVCCNQPMVLQDENTVDAAQEKHVPVIEINDRIATVKVGSVDHPMGEDHYIEWIELVVDGVSYKKFLMPNDKPVVEFQLPAEFSKVYAREYCNLHGLWRSN